MLVMFSTGGEGSRGDLLAVGEALQLGGVSSQRVGLSGETHVDAGGGLPGVCCRCEEHRDERIIFKQK